MPLFSSSTLIITRKSYGAQTSNGAINLQQGDTALCWCRMRLDAVPPVIVFLLVVTLLVKPMGAYLERVFERQKTFLDPLLLPIERLIHRIVWSDLRVEMDWKRYSLAFGLFSTVNIVALSLLLLIQARLPWFFPKVMTTPMTPDLAINTAVSFVTTTTWQAYPARTR
jgi:potassium-transporting ATPase potassium-binding subunit